MKPILKLSLLTLVAASLAALPLTTTAQPATDKAADKKAAAATDKTEAPKGRPVPFKGKLTAVDKVAKTITVGERVFQITSETKIFTADKKPAMLETGVVGEPVTGSYKKAAGDKLNAVSVYFGVKTGSVKEGEKKGSDAKDAAKDTKKQTQ